MTNHLLLYPMAAHIAWVAFLYVLLSIVCAPAVWGVIKNKRDIWASVEPRISANLSNQFEWPLFFHVTCVLLIVMGNGDPVQLWLAWIFVAGRLIHSFVQILTNNIRLRGLVFTINFLAVLAMWFFLLI
ncbi:MAPEG family protein [Kangiella sp.]|uniref:MAPEG family protein n=1 Tax=Kangiella sp. TaxID=1920245 RepID=UPI00198CA7EE|nr:MAPEG family protein [Kangiella sp.]MBD3652375.1 MAPEG family protein [Kangiella sp.]